MLSKAPIHHFSGNNVSTVQVLSCHSALAMVVASSCHCRGVIPRHTQRKSHIRLWRVHTGLHEFLYRLSSALPAVSCSAAAPWPSSTLVTRISSLTRPLKRMTLQNEHALNGVRGHHGFMRIPVKVMRYEMVTGKAQCSPGSAFVLAVTGRSGLCSLNDKIQLMICPRQNCSR